jgi:homocysteine S-methyltransferase
MADVLQPFLRNGGTLVLDGGLATELERAGFDLDHPLWSARLLAERPDAIAAVHRAYLEAGADCITTASYQATIEGFRRAGATGPGPGRPRAPGWWAGAAGPARTTSARCAPRSATEDGSGMA